MPSIAANSATSEPIDPTPIRPSFEPGPIPSDRRAASTYSATDLRDDPAASPVYSDLRGLPPIRIQIGSVELFRRQNEVLVQRARDAGTDARIALWADMVHGFWALGPLFPAEAALQQVAAWIWELGRR